MTHHAWSGVGDTTLVGHPLMCGPLLVCKGSQEGPAHVVHAVHAHSRALENATAGNDKSGMREPSQPSWLCPGGSPPPAPHLEVEKTAYSSGDRRSRGDSRNTSSAGKRPS